MKRLKELAEITYEIEGPIDELIDKLEQIKSYWSKKGYSEFTVETTVEFEPRYYDSPECHYVKCVVTGR